MTRPIVLSNGSLHVGINLYGMVHDFYYPYVGLENHATANNMRWRIGIWCSDGFSWLDDGNWEFTIDYEHSALVGDIKARHKTLGVLLEMQSCVDTDFNVFMRNIHVVNERDTTRDIKLFLHQVVRISNNLNGDTAQYLPLEQAILHYKGSRAFVFCAEAADGTPFDQYSVGVYGIEGKEGTFRDAEDGKLEGNAVEHGSVDSVMGFTLPLEPHGSARVTYWVAAGVDRREALHVLQRVRLEGVHQRMLKTANYWREWLRPADTFMEMVEPSLRESIRKSLLIIKSHIDKHGAVIASTDTTMRNYARDAYVYCWPRDAAFGLWPLLRLGYFEEVKNFFYFCRRGLQPEGFLMHKYLADGSPGSSWHPYSVEGRVVPPIQEDETAIVLFLLGQYYHMTEDAQALQEFYDPLVRPAANFLANYIDEATKLPHASYDIWEQKFLTTTYTTAVVYAALLAAARLAEVMGRQQEAVSWQAVADDMRQAAQHQLFNKDKQFFHKGFIRKKNQDGQVSMHYDQTIDVSSFYGAFMFGLFDVESDEVKQSYNTLEKTFGFNAQSVTPIPRYENDRYNSADPNSKGNPWFVTTLWLAQYYIETKHVEQAKNIIQWVQSHMLPSGVLAEQMSPDTYKFISVAPLMWSQAEFINAIIDLSSDPVKAIIGAEKT
jgi:GH15 family glucan-1,4-alpha-glucosidase